jgi:hypothetical protein
MPERVVVNTVCETISNGRSERCAAHEGHLIDSPARERFTSSYAATLSQAWPTAGARPAGKLSVHLKLFDALSTGGSVVKRAKLPKFNAASDS